MSEDLSSELTTITVTGEGSGITLNAKPPSKFNCAEFTLRDDMPLGFLHAPWIQFEPIEMSEWRLKMATEVVRRTLMHENLVKRIQDLEMIRKKDQEHYDKLHKSRQTAFKMWAEERKKQGLPEDFSDIKDWPAELKGS